MFSVIIPLYNKVAFIESAINSVLQQDYKDFEIIVINDGSTDGGVELVSKKFGNNIKLINQINSGVSAARNAGIANSKFPWVAFLDADDYWASTYLSSLNKFIKDNSQINIIGSSYGSRLEDLECPLEINCFPIENYFKKAIKYTYFFTSATAIRRDFFFKNSGFDPKIKLGEDLDVWFRAILYYGKAFYIPHRLVFYNQNDLNAATKQKYLLSETLIYKIHKKDYFPWQSAYSNEDIKDFKKFKIKWTYFTLYPLFRSKENFDDLSLFIRSLSNKYFLVRLFYLLPKTFINAFVKSGFLSHHLRNYMKFCFRFIYK
ncbi:glycosyltransferase family 2 protein [Cecembia rubra]|uniref:Cellulose synthase/poly-beta-1,6-N-acetylglucosamine synthase-like glycosyltransferase n=1 Tax=Cecembia rubra TaxID=1485585 RepID=A0A2P8DVR0_9BACT|nr:glycosyltransferase family A protein [Cecembia rubra]PSL01257.1 cellulose synthase/poly-beta-1,6-N-acetylglucosamine synthase-like glycosyltransferase [Cecembia rubra]